MKVSFEVALKSYENYSNLGKPIHSAPSWVRGIPLEYKVLVLILSGHITYNNLNKFMIMNHRFSVTGSGMERINADRDMDKSMLIYKIDNLPIEIIYNMYGVAKES